MKIVVGTKKPEPNDAKAKKTEILFDDVRFNLIGKKADHYIPKFNDLEQGKSGGWNWWGLLIGPLWFAYRKMYLESALAFLVSYVIGVIVSFLVGAWDNPSLASVGSSCCLAWSAVQGGMANKVYWWRISKLAAKIPSSEDARWKYIRRKGGTSAKAVVIAILLVIALDVLALAVGLA